MQEYLKNLNSIMTIEERADAYVGHPEEIDEFTTETIKRDAYIRGAKEQKAIDEEVRLKKSDSMTQAEYEREVAFADWYNKNGKGTPTYSDAIEWARRELIDEACEWIDKYLHLFVMKGNILYPKLAQEFRKSMEE